MKLAISLVLVCACATETKSPDPGDPDPVGTIVNHGPISDEPPPATCPLGAATFATVLGATTPSQLMRLAVESDGDVLAAGSGGAVVGVTELSASGAVLMKLPIGSQVATDAADNIYIAGDGFVQELDPTGKVVFTKSLEGCVTGAVSLAVGADGRIAVSGTTGTVVLAPGGAFLFGLPEAGQVGFDSTGDLLIAGSQTATELAFLERIDRDGKLVVRTSFDGHGVRFTRLVIDASDNIIFVGDTSDFVDLFGVDITAQFSPESGRVTGAFAVKVDASFTPLFVLDLGIVEANDVVVDASDELFIAGAATVNTGFFRSIVILEVDPAGNVTSFDFGNGRAVAIAVDACGSVLAGLVQQASPIPGSPINAVVEKLVL